ncbi:hypothetical protein BC628DRAFT_568477 [Trametes gibbosa]|nr:hypothetical protein BC628DRAFT_568477 [Trametes gibbosa]
MLFGASSSCADSCRTHTHILTWPGQCILAGGDLAEHASAARRAADAGRPAGHQPVAAVPDGSEHGLWSARKGVPGCAHASERTAACAGPERGRGAGGEADGTGDMRGDVPGGEIPAAGGRAGVPVLGCGEQLPSVGAPRIGVDHARCSFLAHDAPGTTLQNFMRAPRTTAAADGQTLTAMRQLHSEGAVLRELIDQFEAAEAWLAPMRP